jgi:hypothetical protein
MVLLRSADNALSPDQLDEASHFGAGGLDSSFIDMSAEMV